MTQICMSHTSRCKIWPLLVNTELSFPQGGKGEASDLNFLEFTNLSLSFRQASVRHGRYLTHLRAFTFKNGGRTAQIEVGMPRNNS